MPFTWVLHINYMYLPFQEAGVPGFLSKLCTSAQPCLRRISRIQQQTGCLLHRNRTRPKGHDPQITCNRVLTAPMVMDALSTFAGVIRRTCENSRWLAAFVFCNIIADVTGRVTRREQAFNIERSKLEERHRRETVRHCGLG